MGKHILWVSLILAQLIYVNCFGWAVVAIGTTALGSIIKIIDRAEVWTVEVHNEGKHHAHMWCASADDKIGGDEGVWVKPGDKITWSFGRKPTTQFWCNMDWYGQRVGWDVFVTNWKDAPNPTKWSIRNDGVYDQWQNHDRIGGSDGLWVRPGGKLSWSFRRNGSTTQYWCTMDWYGQRVGWDVFVGNTQDAPDPTKWSIRNDGVYDQWRNRKWRHLNS